MYVKRIQLANYGPVERLDIEFPFGDGAPQPVVLVGGNGSGKSILLSHIVNGLVAAKGCAFPDSPEVELNKVYKLRSSSYIRAGSEYYFSRVDFEDDFFVSEIRTRRRKIEYDNVPSGIEESSPESMWNRMDSEENDEFHTNLSRNPQTTRKARNLFSRNCVLYFPFDRYEEPAWLNEENLNAQARQSHSRHVVGETDRRVISYSPLHQNQDWLYGVVFDRAAFEFHTRDVALPANEGRTTASLPVFLGYSGDATRTYETALTIVRAITQKEDARFGIGRRDNRAISIQLRDRELVPNIFQLSSGETSLLNLFLSVLRDFGSSGSRFEVASDIRGIVIVDEVDLHLNATHQYEVLPNLISMFPKVQFIVTTHSPLFVLGMQRAIGAHGFGLYQLPQGQQINPEEFAEFGDAYRTFAATRRFEDDMRTAIEELQIPIVFVEGTTDQNYIERAATLLGKQSVIDAVRLRDGGGSGNLTKIWKESLAPLIETLPQQVLLLFDCDSGKPSENKGKLFQRSIPSQENSPIRKGVENLFGKQTLERARQHKAGFFITEEEHGGTDKTGLPVTIAEKWIVNEGEKRNLCDWLCENGTTEDFQNFDCVFNIVEQVVALNPSSPSEPE